MPKFRHTGVRKCMSGVLGVDPHPYHRHWRFTYEESGTDSYQDILDNTDLEQCAKKKQVKIVGGSVLLYVGERANSVDVDLYLPSQVTMVIIHKYGKQVPFCYATVGGGKNCSVFAGKTLKKHPHAKRLK